METNDGDTIKTHPKRSVIYPWTVERAFREESVSEYEAMGYNAVYENYQKYFDTSPKYFDHLENTPSHKLANDILAWIFKDAKYDAMWFTLLFASSHDYPYVLNSAKLACLVYSLTTGTASMLANPQTLTQAFTEAYKDDQSDLFDTMTSSGLLLMTGLDLTCIDSPKTSTAFNDLFQERIASPQRRTIILCQLPVAYQQGYTKGKVHLAQDFGTMAGLFKIPVADTVTDDFSEKAQPFREYKLFPDKLVKEKRVKLPDDHIDFFMKSRVEVMHSISTYIGKGFAHNINNTADSLYVY